MVAGRGGRRGPRGPCPYPHEEQLATPREAACGCGDGIGQGSLSLGVVPACRLAPPRRGDCPGPSAGRTVARGCCMCQRGDPSRVVDPAGVSGSFGVPPAWEAPGRPGTAAAGGLRRVLGSPVIQGFPRYHDPAWPHGCAGRRAGATASGVHSFVSILLSLVSIFLQHCAILWSAGGQGMHATEQKQHKLSHFNVSGRVRRALFSSQSAML